MCVCVLVRTTALKHTVVLVVHGMGDQYTDAAPWLSSLESSVRQLQRGVDSLVAPVTGVRRRQAENASSILLLPVEYHSVAMKSLRTALQQSLPQYASGRTDPAAAVRDAIEDTLGALLIASSPCFRQAVTKELATQMRSQIAAVRRARPAFQVDRSVSIFAHSTGAVYVLDMLRSGILEDAVPYLDAVVLAGCPAPAYAALNPRFAAEVRDAVLDRRDKRSVRIFNVYHPMDPVSYRMEPWILADALSGTFSADDDSSASSADSASACTVENAGGGSVSGVRFGAASPVDSSVSSTAVDSRPLPPPVRVGRVDKKTLWQEAIALWGNTVQTVLSSLFPQRTTVSRGAKPFSTATASKNASSNNRDVAGDNDDEAVYDSHVFHSTEDDSLAALPVISESGQDKVPASRSRAGYGSTDVGRSKLSNKSYIVKKADSGEDLVVGREALLGDRIDYELHDGVGAYAADLATNWAAVKAHGFYWRSLEVARILVDIAETSQTRDE